MRWGSNGRDHDGNKLQTFQEGKAKAVERMDTPPTSADICGNHVTYAACMVTYGQCVTSTVTANGGITKFEVTSGQGGAKVAEKQDIV